MNEPLKGWIDSPAASGGIVLGYETGMLHIVYATRDAKLDIIPCDLVTNNILVQTAVTAM